ncbi:hypothetical protein [Corynebacterium sp. HMSC074A01]|uniref:hypothetical protein n=1 Tax=Corynebacterium sp. HMSC074A01 TaxID=1715030 RepID=UPI0008A311A7|nr:hypothetical protein [Corynebacterium sp. HMSC074A01]OHF35812.1 hypothetical protein HMPREF2550_10280 [Corynebacterium sp. HMSC074A01]
MIAFVVVSIALLAWESIKLARGPKRPGRALLNAILAAAVVWLLVSPLDFNADLPIWLWWAIVAWASVLVGVAAGRLALQRF